MSLTHSVTLCNFVAHIDDVRALVMRAIKDLSIEQSLKTYEEVWLSKVFELEEHIRNKMAAKLAHAHENALSQKEASIVINVSMKHCNWEFIFCKAIYDWSVVVQSY